MKRQAYTPEIKERAVRMLIETLAITPPPGQLFKPLHRRLAARLKPYDHGIKST